MNRTIASTAALVAPLASLAHPGHGESEGFSVVHYFTEPVHAVVTVLAISAGIGLFVYLRRRASGHKKA